MGMIALEEGDLDSKVRQKRKSLKVKFYYANNKNLTLKERIELATTFEKLFIVFSTCEKHEVTDVVVRIHKKLEEQNDCLEVLQMIFSMEKVWSQAEEIRFNKRPRSEWSRLENMISIYLCISISKVDPDPGKTSKSFIKLLELLDENIGLFPSSVLSTIYKKIYEINLFCRLTNKEEDILKSLLSGSGV